MHAANVVCNVSMICLNDSLCQALGQWRRAKKQASEKRRFSRRFVFSIRFSNYSWSLQQAISIKKFFLKTPDNCRFSYFGFGFTEKKQTTINYNNLQQLPRRQAWENECRQIPFFRFYSRWLKKWLEFC